MPHTNALRPDHPDQGPERAKLPCDPRSIQRMTPVICQPVAGAGGIEAPAHDRQPPRRRLFPAHRICGAPPTPSSRTARPRATAARTICATIRYARRSGTRGRREVGQPRRRSERSNRQSRPGLCRVSPPVRPKTATAARQQLDLARNGRTRAFAHRRPCAGERRRDEHVFVIRASARVRPLKAVPNFGATRRGSRTIGAFSRR